MVSFAVYQISKTKKPNITKWWQGCKLVRNVIHCHSLLAGVFIGTNTLDSDWTRWPSMINILSKLGIRGGGGTSSPWQRCKDKVEQEKRVEYPGRKKPRCSGETWRAGSHAKRAVFPGGGNGKAFHGQSHTHGGARWPWTEQTCARVTPICFTSHNAVLSVPENCFTISI